MMKRRKQVVYTRQEVVFLKDWIPAGQPGAGCVNKAKRVPIAERPGRVWTLYRESDENKPPVLPIIPVHNVNAFLEDYVHDWNEVRGKDGKLMLDYSSRVIDRPVWILLEYEK